MLQASDLFVYAISFYNFYIFLFVIFRRSVSKMTLSTEPAFHKSCSIEVNGVQTDILYHKFLNRALLIINQYEKINNIFVARNEHTFNGLVQNKSVDIQHKFGRDTDDIQSALMHLIARVPVLRDAEMELVVNVGLKEVNRVVLTTLEKVLNESL